MIYFYMSEFFKTLSGYNIVFKSPYSSFFINPTFFIKPESPLYISAFILFHPSGKKKEREQYWCRI